MSGAVRITADAVHEIIALREESRDLDHLANQFETRHKVAA